MSHLYNDIFSWILYLDERIHVQMGIRSADVCHGIRETFHSPFVKKHQRDESSMEGNGLAMYARGMS